MGQVHGCLAMTVLVNISNVLVYSVEVREVQGNKCATTRSLECLQVDEEQRNDKEGRNEKERKGMIQGSPGTNG